MRFVYLGVIILVLTGCRNASYPTVRNNVCKTLEKDVVLFAVFVDSDKTHPWTEFDINSTLDSINVAVDWLHTQAKSSGIKLNVKLAYASNGITVPFKGELKYGTLSGTLYHYMPNLQKGIDLVDDWSNNISKRVGKTIEVNDSEMILTLNKSNDRERLIAKLRDVHGTDNIGLMFFINNYYENELSVAIHTGNDVNTEYAVVSNKYPSVIIHEYLHLFGAEDLYRNPFKRRLFFAKAKLRKLNRRYPNEIMAFAYRDIRKLSISELSKYLIGWNTTLSKKDEHFLFGLKYKALTY